MRIRGLIALAACCVACAPLTEEQEYAIQDRKNRMAELENMCRNSGRVWVTQSNSTPACLTQMEANQLWRSMTNRF